MSTLAKIAQNLKLSLLTPRLVGELECEIKEGHVGDLLSDVLANAPEGGVLVTIQVHLNVIAVAVHARLKAVIFASGMMPEEEVIKKAKEEGVVLYSSQQSSFELVGKLYGMGIRGRNA